MTVGIEEVLLPEEQLSGRTFTDEDRELLHSYGGLIEGLAELFGKLAGRVFRLTGGDGTNALLQLNHQGVVALQVPSDIGQLLALQEYPLGQYFLARQNALTHPFAKGFVAYLNHSLQHARLFKLDRRVAAQQFVYGDQTVAGGQGAVAHLLLQNPSRYTHKLGGAPDADMVGLDDCYLLYSYKTM